MNVKRRIQWATSTAENKIDKTVTRGRKQKIKWQVKEEKKEKMLLKATS